PLLSSDGSDSQSLDELLELLVATGWDLGPALLTAMPEAQALRRAPHPPVATLRPRAARLAAPAARPAAARRPCWRRGTARRRSSSVTAGGWGRSVTATGCDRRRSR